MGGGSRAAARVSPPTAWARAAARAAVVTAQTAWPASTACHSAGEHGRQDGQERDELDRRLAPLIGDAPHAATLAGKVSRRYARVSRKRANSLPGPEIRPNVAVTRR